MGALRAGASSDGGRNVIASTSTHAWTRRMPRGRRRGGSHTKNVARRMRRARPAPLTRTGVALLDRNEVVNVAVKQFWAITARQLFSNANAGRMAEVAITDHVAGRAVEGRKGGHVSELDHPAQHVFRTANARRYQDGACRRGGIGGYPQGDRRSSRCSLQDRPNRLRRQRDLRSGMHTPDVSRDGDADVGSGKIASPHVEAVCLLGTATSVRGAVRWVVAINGGVRGRRHVASSGSVGNES